MSLASTMLGAALVIWGFQMADAPANQVAQSITGSSSDAVMYRYIGGALALAAGAYLFFKK